MTPFQTYGVAAPPSNLAFPTAAYLQASQNAAEMQMRGQEALGKGIAGGISSVASAFKEHKEEQAKFDATKKLFKAFGGSLNEEERKGIQEILDDTSISTREKNAVTPVIMQYMGAAQQQRQALEKQKAELDARMAQQAAGDEEARKREMLRLQAEAERFGGPAPATEGGSAMSGAPFYDQGFAAPQQQPNPFGSTLKKRHFGMQ